MYARGAMVVSLSTGGIVCPPSTAGGSNHLLVQLRLEVNADVQQNYVHDTVRDRPRQGARVLYKDARIREARRLRRPRGPILDDCFQGSRLRGAPLARDCGASR